MQNLSQATAHRTSSHKAENRHPPRLVSALLTLVLFFGAACSGLQRTAEPTIPQVVLPEEKIEVEVELRPDPVAYGHFLKGLLASERGDRMQAIAHFKEVVRRQPKAREARTRLFRLLLAEGQIATAFAVIDNAGQLRGVPASQTYLFARLFAWSGKSKNLEQLIAYLPESEEWIGRKAELSGYLALLKGDSAKAKLQFARAVEFDETDWPLYFNGRILEAEGKLKQALANYEQALAANPGFALAWYRTGVVQERQKNQKQAKESYSMLEKTGPRGMDAVQRRVLIELEQSIPPVEVLTLDDVFPGNATAIAAQAYQSWMLEEPSLALNLLLFANSRDPLELSANLILGVIARQQEQTAAAVERFARVAEKEGPFRNDALRELASTMIESDGREQLAKMIESMRKGKINTPMLKLMGRLAAHYEGAENALAYFAESTRTVNSAESWYQYLITLESLGRHREAVAVAEIASHRWPDHVDTINFLGYSWAEDGTRLDEARRLLERAMKLKPWAGYVMDSMAWVYYRQQTFEKAEIWIKMVAQYSSPDPLVYEHYGDILLASGKLPFALEIYRKAVDMQPPEPDLENLQIKIKRLERAIRH